MTAKTSPLETYHVGKAHRKVAMWAAQSHEDSWVPSKPSAGYQDPAMQGLHAGLPTCQALLRATRRPLRLFMSHGRKHIHDTRPGGQHRNRAPPPQPITGHVFHTGRLVGDRGHCRHPPAHPAQRSGLDYPHIEPNPRVQPLLTVSISLPSWSEPHWSRPYPLGLAPILTQDLAISALARYLSG